MPHCPPIKRRELKKKGVFNEDRFYEDLAVSCGYISKEVARRYYLALVRVMTARLKKEDVVRLPHLGDFALVEQKAKMSLVGKEQKVLPSRKILRFYPANTWREYFSKLNLLKSGDRT